MKVPSTYFLDTNMAMVRAGRENKYTMGNETLLDDLNSEIIACTKCPRLVAWREQVAIERRASFADQEYWGKPVPSFGSNAPRVLIVGLAPAAHGANRTGRMFTGDRSGEWLYRALFKAGLANQPQSDGVDDGLTLVDTRITAAAHCAPPANKPTREEFAHCAGYLHRELELCALTVRCIVALGSLAWNAVIDAYGIKPRPKFGHGATFTVEQESGPVTIVGSYHPSQQNTFTGKLTEPMFDEIFALASRS